MFYNYNISIVGAQYHIYKLNLYNNIIMMIILYPWWVCKTLVIIIVGFTGIHSATLSNLYIDSEV